MTSIKIDIKKKSYVFIYDKIHLVDLNIGMFL